VGDRAGRVVPGDDYDDLAEAVTRGALAGDGSLEYAGELRERYTIEIGSLASMLADLLGQIVGDAGSLRRARVILRIPAELQAAWTRRKPLAGLDATAAWLASRRPDRERIMLVPGVRAHRGDDYSDLARAVETVAAAGDGALDPARLRRRYTIERASWLRMACSRWPVAPTGDAIDLAAYTDLAEAVERGAVDGDNTIEITGVRDSYTLPLDSWARMTGELLGQIIADAGSIRRAAKVIDVPRSTLGQWVKQRRERGELGL
jgi:hypothetical protein